MSQPLAETIFWIAAAACAIAEIAILRFSFAAQRANKSELVPTAPRSGEIAWAIIPALALIAVLFATWQRIEGRESHMRMMDHSATQHSMPMPAGPSSPRAR
jgi:heme/copper-type cytochrome/quinol oxidase subunit 2